MVSACRQSAKPMTNARRASVALRAHVRRLLPVKTIRAVRTLRSVGGTFASHSPSVSVIEVVRTDGSAMKDIAGLRKSAQMMTPAKVSMTAWAVFASLLCAAAAVTALMVRYAKEADAVRSWTLRSLRW